MRVVVFGVALALIFVSAASSAETQCVRDAEGNFTCRESSMSSPADLEAIYGVGSPTAYEEGRRQIEQSNRLLEQELQQRRLANERAAMANQFEAQNHALRLENQRLKNEALASSNEEKRKLEAQPFQLSQSQLASALGASDAEIRNLISQAERMSADPDPATRIKGQRLTRIAKAVVEVRQSYKR